MAACVTNVSLPEGVPPCLRTSSPLGGTLGVHRTSWRILLPRHASRVYLVLGSEVLGCRTLRLKSQSSAGLRMQPYPRFADLAWPGHLHSMGCLSAPGYGHWVFYHCVALVFGSGFRGNPASRGGGLGCVCLGTGFVFAPPILAGVCGVCVWAWGFACTPPILAGVLDCLCLCARSASTPPSLAGSVVRVFGHGLWLYPAICGLGVWCGCVCVCGFGFWLVPANPGSGVAVCVCVCVFVLALRWCPAIPGWGVRCWCSHLG